MIEPVGAHAARAQRGDRRRERGDLGERALDRDLAAEQVVRVHRERVLRVRDAVDHHRAAVARQARRSGRRRGPSRSPRPRSRSRPRTAREALDAAVREVALDQHRGVDAELAGARRAGARSARRRSRARRRRWRASARAAARSLPEPRTSALVPGRGLSVSRPCSAHAVGSANTATSGSRPSTSKTTSAGTVISSAKPPSLLEPMPVRLRHSSCRPRRHWSQCPQLMLGLTVTHCPVLDGGHLGADGLDGADDLVAGHERELRGEVTFVDVLVGAAEPGLVDADPHVPRTGLDGARRLPPRTRAAAEYRTAFITTPGVRRCQSSAKRPARAEAGRPIALRVQQLGLVDRVLVLG